MHFTRETEETTSIDDLAKQYLRASLTRAVEEMTIQPDTLDVVDDLVEGSSEPDHVKAAIHGLLKMNRRTNGFQISIKGGYFELDMRVKMSLKLLSGLVGLVLGITTQPIVIDTINQLFR